MSECVVKASDFKTYWLGQQTDDGDHGDQDAPAVWDGPDRRAQIDRRTSGHERRWEACVGRRFKERRRR